MRFAVPFQIRFSKVTAKLAIYAIFLMKNGGRQEGKRVQNVHLVNFPASLHQMQFILTKRRFKAYPFDI